MYYQGQGVAEDPVKAMEWYRKAAEQGYAAAQRNLGWMYDQGRGVAEDPVKAAEWYHKAAVQGDADAQRSLGLMYNLGRGVAKDPVKAKEWDEWSRRPSGGAMRKIVFEDYPKFP
jgi:TPR repeat protein